MVKKKECKTCGYVWTPRVTKPVECPNCKARLNKRVIK